jgi:hypothetical protein
MWLSRWKYNGTIADYIPTRIKVLEGENEKLKGDFNVGY